MSPVRDPYQWRGWVDRVLLWIGEEHVCQGVGSKVVVRYVTCKRPISVARVGW